MHPGKHSVRPKAAKKGAAKPPAKDFAHMARAVESAISLSKARPGGRINWGVIQNTAMKANAAPRAVAIELVNRGYQVPEIIYEPAKKAKK